MQDELKIYRGDDYFVKEGIVIHQPTLGEICDYGESAYYSMVCALTFVPADLKWQLDEMGVDYTKLEDFELFYKLLYRGYSKEQTSILFGPLDLQEFSLCRRKDSGDIVLYDAGQDLLIDDAKEEYLLSKNKESHSQLKNLISAMINSEGFKYNHSEVWNMKINAFMDSVRRISKIQNALLLLQSGYSGFGVNLKDLDPTQTDWLGELK